MALGATLDRITRWKLDPNHSSIEFTTKHMMITTVRGRFKDVAANVVANAHEPEKSSIEVEIDAASLDTGAPDRDEHLRSAEFFNVEQYPKITFRSTGIDVGSAKGEDGDRFKIVGDLEIAGTSQEVELEAEFEGLGKDPWGGQRAGFRVTGDIDRRDWELRWNQTLETGGVLVANRVRLDIDVQFVMESG